MSLKAALTGERTPLDTLTLDRERVLAMLTQAREEAKSGDAGAELIVQALEHEAADIDRAYRRELEAFANGGPVGRTIGRGESVRDVVTAPSEVNLRGLVRGLALGDWGNTRPEVVALMTSGVPAAIPGYASAGIVDLAREQSVVFRAGAQLMPVDTASAKVARMTSEPAVEWEPEAADRDLTDGAWTFDAAELTASSAWLYTTLTIEAVEDAIDLDSVVQNAFAQQLALTFDQAGLVGTGADMPVGIVTMGHAQDRIIEQLAVGEVASYAPFVRAAGAVRAAHHEPSSVILTPGLWTELGCLTDQNDNPLQAPRAYTALDEFVSGFLPSNGGTGEDEHTAIVGDLSALTVGVRTDITVEVSRLGAGMKKGAVEVRGYVRFGTYLTRPDAVAVLRGITLPAAA